LPARLDVAATAELLGFAEHDIQILMAVGKLTPLGDPAPNAPKWFAAVEMFRLAADKDWLHKATKEIAKHWLHKRRRHMNPLDAKAGFGQAPASNQTLSFERSEVRAQKSKN
jgi:hypothetical protein